MMPTRAVPLILALWSGAVPADVSVPAVGELRPVAGGTEEVRVAVAEVNEVRVSPAGGETEIVILARASTAGGELEARDFLLSDPTRLIVDLEGALHRLPRYTYDGIGRGGVVRLRSSQFRDDVVRLVFDLTGIEGYRLERGDGSVRIRFRNPGGAFEEWTTAGVVPRSAATTGSARAGRSPAGPPGAAAAVAFAERVGATRAATGLPVAAAPGGVEAAARQQTAQPRISVTYDQAEMLDVLAGFAEFSGISIVPSPAVSNRAVRGVEIRDKPWDVALDAILEAQGLGWRRLESGIIVVDELSAIRARDTLQTETRVIRINYADAQNVSQALQNLASEKGQVSAYPETNSVIVQDAPTVVSRMDSLVQVLDRRTPQVSIEAKIVFVDRTSTNALGLTYDLKDLSGNQLAGAVENPDPQNPGETTEDDVVLFGGSSVAAVANAAQSVPGAALRILGSVSFGDFSLFAFLEALESEQLSDVQAAPSIQVVDNQTARIQVGEETAVRVIEAGGQVQQAQANVEFVDTGIILEVTPHITNNNQILLDLMAERSGIQQAGPDVGFIFDKQEGRTRLLLDDGETAVIGGLTTSEVTRNEDGVPGLMNIPLIGGLFRTSQETEVKQDLIILVTPHIVSKPDVGIPTVPPASADGERSD